jgi:hypothetical protein
VSFDDTCALQLGKTRGGLLRQGIMVSPVDLMIGTIALVHNLTLVTYKHARFPKHPRSPAGRLAGLLPEAAGYFLIAALSVGTKCESKSV